MLAEMLADNGAYFLAAYAIVIGGLGGYVFWLHRRLAAASAKPRGRA
jgi:CcmD family protein